MLYTSNKSYRPRAGETVIDVTAKSANTPFGKLVAPEWDWVMGLKKGLITWDGYRNLYLRKLELQREAILAEWTKLAVDIVLVCYCKTDEHCHRRLLSDFLCAEGVAQFGGEL